MANGGLFGGIASGLQSGIALQQRQQALQQDQIKAFQEKVQKNLKRTDDMFKQLLSEGGIMKASGVKFEDYAAMIKQTVTERQRLAQMAGIQSAPLNEQRLAAALQSVWVTPQEAEAAAFAQEREQKEILATDESAIETEAIADRQRRGLTAIPTVPTKNFQKGNDQVSVMGDDRALIKSLQDQGYVEISKQLGQASTLSEVSRFQEPEQKDITEIKSSGVKVENLLNTGNSIVRNLIDAPDANTAYASIAQFAQGAKAEAQAFARGISDAYEVLGASDPDQPDQLLVVDDDGKESTDYGGALRRAQAYADSLASLATASAKNKSLVVSMAFQAAAAAEQGGRFSDQDIRFQMERLGATYSNHISFATAVNEVQREAVEKFKTTVRWRGGTEYDALVDQGVLPALPEILTLDAGRQTTPTTPGNIIDFNDLQ